MTKKNLTIRFELFLEIKASKTKTPGKEYKYPVSEVGRGWLGGIGVLIFNFIHRFGLNLNEGPHCFTSLFGPSSVSILVSNNSFFVSLLFSNWESGLRSSIVSADLFSEEGALD